MVDSLLPLDFADLEPFAEIWCLPTDRERFAQRRAGSMAELQAFYDAVFPRVEEAITYCDQFPLDAMPDDAVRLLQIVHSFAMVSFQVEVAAAEPVDGSITCIDRLTEPLP